LLVVKVHGEVCVPKTKPGNILGWKIKADGGDLLLCFDVMN